MRVQRWGDDLAVRLPSDVVERLGLREGDDVALTIAPTLEEDEAAVASPETTDLTALTRQEAVARLAANAQPTPPGYRFDREEANAR